MKYPKLQQNSGYRFISLVSLCFDLTDDQGDLCVTRIGDFDPRGDIATQNKHVLSYTTVVLKNFPHVYINKIMVKIYIITSFYTLNRLALFAAHTYTYHAVSSLVPYHTRTMIPQSI